MPRSSVLLKSSSTKDPSYLAVARVRRPFGLKGELLLAILTDFPDRLTQNETLYAGDERLPFGGETIRRHGTDTLLRLKAVRDCDAAEKLRGGGVFFRRGG